MNIRGHCHCGNIEFEMDWTGKASELRGRTCSCSYCRMHGASWTSHPEVSVTARIEDKEQIIVYRFGHQTAEFYVCARCGILPFASCGGEDGRVAVVNINTFKDFKRDEIDFATTNFDGESNPERLARRNKNWSPLCIL